MTAWCRSVAARRSEHEGGRLGTGFVSSVITYLNIFSCDCTVAHNWTTKLQVQDHSVYPKCVVLIALSRANRMKMKLGESLYCRCIVIDTHHRDYDHHHHHPCPQSNGPTPLPSPTPTPACGVQTVFRRDTNQFYRDIDAPEELLRNVTTSCRSAMQCSFGQILDKVTVIMIKPRI